MFFVYLVKHSLTQLLSGAVIHQSLKKTICYSQSSISVTILVKIKLSLCLTKYRTLKTYGEVELKLHAFLSSPQDGGEWSASRPGERTLVPTGHEPGYMGPRASLDAVKQRKNSCPWRESSSGRSVGSIFDFIYLVNQ